MLSHGCQSPTEGQPKASLLGKMKDIELRVLTPDRWRDYGNWRTPHLPADASFDLRATRVCLPWLGPAQSYLHFYPDLAAQVASFGPDVINVWEEPWSLVSAHACRVRDRVCPNAKLIVETEQNIFKRLPPPFRQIRGYVLSRTDGMVARSNEAVRVLRKLGYSRSAKLVPNAVDTHIFRPMSREVSLKGLFNETGRDWSSRFIVGFIGRIVVEKGIFELLEAVARCPSDVVLLAIGSGSAVASAVQRCQKLGLQERVIFLPARNQEELPAIFGAMNVLAVPSRTTSSWKEQFGRVIIEAHACGIPVIGSSSGAIPEVIGRGGQVVAEQDPDALATAIKELRGHLVRLECLGTFGLEQVRSNYSWRAIADQMHDYYYELAGPVS